MCSAAVVVSQVDSVYHVTDVEGDVRYPTRAVTMEQVKSLLGEQHLDLIERLTLLHFYSSQRLLLGSSMYWD